MWGQPPKFDTSCNAGFLHPAFFLRQSSPSWAGDAVGSPGKYFTPTQQHAFGSVCQRRESADRAYPGRVVKSVKSFTLVIYSSVIYRLPPYKPRQCHRLCTVGAQGNSSIEVRAVKNTSGSPLLNPHCSTWCERPMFPGELHISGRPILRFEAWAVGHQGWLPPY